MTTTLKFKQGDSGTTLDLNSSSSTGFRLDENGWNLAVATPVHMSDPPPVLERLDLLLSNTNYDNLASNMQSLHEMQVLADRYINDPTQENPVWLHAKMDGETGERRALVHSITIQYKAPWFGAGQSTTNIPLVLTVVRGPYWESTTVRNLPDSGSLTGACVTYNYTAAGDAVGAHDIVGDVGARLRFFPIDDDGNNGVNRFWMGLRSANKHGADGITNFVDTWECEDGTNSTDATDAVDATGSDGNIVVVSESGIDWDDGDFHQVLYITLTNASANEEDQFGNFLWLLRTGIQTNEWEVKLKFGYSSTPSASLIETDIIEISTPKWSFYEIGVAPITPRNLQSIIESDLPKATEAFRVYIFARRTGGTSGDLYLDCLVPIPIDEGFCKFDTVTGTGNIHTFGQSPKGEYNAVMYDLPTGITKHVDHMTSVENFILPAGDGRIYCSFGRLNSSYIADDIVISPDDDGRYYERWLSWRGSE